MTEGNQFTIHQRNIFQLPSLWLMGKWQSFLVCLILLVLHIYDQINDSDTLERRNAENIGKNSLIALVVLRRASNCLERE